MDKFYTYVVIVAFVILLLALIGLGVILQNQDKGEVFPPIQSKCPDGWFISASGCSIPKYNQKNVGDFSANNLTLADQLYLVNISNNEVPAYRQTPFAPAGGTLSYDIVFKPEALPCDKRKWANMHGILWDGISNYNQC